MPSGMLRWGRGYRHGRRSKRKGPANSGVPVRAAAPRSHHRRALNVNSALSEGRHGGRQQRAARPSKARSWCSNRCRSRNTQRVSPAAHKSGKGWWPAGIGAWMQPKDDPGGVPDARTPSRMGAPMIPSTMPSMMPSRRPPGRDEEHVGDQGGDGRPPKGAPDLPGGSGGVGGVDRTPKKFEAFCGALRPRPAPRWF